MSAPKTALTVDCEQLVVEALRANLDSSVTVDYNTPPNLESTLPFVRVVRTGGGDDNLILDYPNVVVHAFAASEADSVALAITANSVLRDVRGVDINGLGHITRISKQSGPVRVAYENPNVFHAVNIYTAYIKI